MESVDAKKIDFTSDGLDNSISKATLILLPPMAT
jgi:hypothetical protein